MLCVCAYGFLKIIKNLCHYKLFSFIFVITFALWICLFIQRRETLFYYFANKTANNFDQNISPYKPEKFFGNQYPSSETIPLRCTYLVILTSLALLIRGSYPLAVSDEAAVIYASFSFMFSSRTLSQRYWGNTTENRHG